MNTTDLDTLLAAAAASTVRSATIAAELRENSFTRMPLSLEYRLELALEAADAAMRLGPFPFAARGWEELAGSEWRRGEPERVVIDGSESLTGLVHGRLEIGDAAWDVTCERIAFGALTDERLAATIDLVLDETRHWRLDVALEIGAIAIVGDVFTKPRPGIDEALELARPYVDVERYEASLQDGVVVLKRR